MKNNYWTNFWNSNEILNNTNLQAQVGRTINRIPIDKKSWRRTLNFITKKISLKKTDHILDLCAGNGLLTIPFSKKCKAITAVDISEKLTNNITSYELSNVEVIVKDIRDIDFEAETFTKVILLFAIQHLSQSETIRLFRKIHKWLVRGGIFYIGDIPDQDKIFTFFNNKTRQAAYFNSLKNNRPIIGTWFTKNYIKKSASYVGFNSVNIIRQPKFFINSHYRFDAILIK